LKKQNILTGIVSSLLVILALSQASYANESSNHQKVVDRTSNYHSSLVQKTTDKVAMFIQHGKPHKLPTDKKGKKA
jgi:hypothetical protein